MTLRQTIVVSVVLAGLLSSALFASYWFNTTYIGWLINDVPDAVQYRNRWQEKINTISVLQHPAVIHVLPDGCLCRVLTQKHAQELTQKATGSGFHVFQLNSRDATLGQPIVSAHLDGFLSPQIIITRPTGDIAYVGAYSDGVRCNTGNSLVDAFLGSVDSLPKQPVVGLDVQTCRCIGDKAISKSLASEAPGRPVQLVGN